MNPVTRFFKGIFNAKAIHTRHAELMQEAGYVYAKADVRMQDQWGSVGGKQNFREGVVLRGIKNWFALSLINKTDVLPASAIADAELRDRLYETAVGNVLVPQ